MTRGNELPCALWQVIAYPKSTISSSKATSEYMTLVRGEYFLELLLGTRSEIGAEEMGAHIAHCIEQIHKLYEFA